MTNLKRWRGLKDLVRDATLHGSSAIERVHLETTRRPFAVLKRIAPIAAPAAGIEAVHDAVVSANYAAVRAVTRAVDTVADIALEALDDAPATRRQSSDPDYEEVGQCTTTASEASLGAQRREGSHAFAGDDEGSSS